MSSALIVMQKSFWGNARIVAPEPREAIQRTAEQSLDDSLISLMFGSCIIRERMVGMRVDSIVPEGGSCAPGVRGIKSGLIK